MEHLSIMWRDLLFLWDFVVNVYCLAFNFWIKENWTHANVHVCVNILGEVNSLGRRGGVEVEIFEREIREWWDKSARWAGKRAITDRMPMCVSKSEVDRQTHAVSSRHYSDAAHARRGACFYLRKSGPDDPRMRLLWYTTVYRRTRWVVAGQVIPGQRTPRTFVHMSPGLPGISPVRRSLTSPVSFFRLDIACICIALTESRCFAAHLTRPLHEILIEATEKYLKVDVSPLNMEHFGAEDEILWIDEGNYFLKNREQLTTDK